MTSQKAFASKKSQDSTYKRQKAGPENTSPVSGRIGRPGLLRALADPLAASPADILNLQRTHGNRAVQRMIQTKLTVGPAGGKYEQEADLAASQVISTPSRSATIRSSKEEENVQRIPVAVSIPRIVQRDVNEKEDELAQELPLVRRASHLDGFEAGSAVETRLAANKGHGAPLPGETRSFMESRFGADFNRVRVHTDGESAQLNRELGAQAFTHGSDIYMGAGKYNPGTTEGKRLLAHELTHVVQQGGGKSNEVQTKLAVGPAGDRYEQEADQVADQVMAAPTSTAPVAQRTAALTPGPEMFFRHGTDAPGSPGGQTKKADEMSEEARSISEQDRPVIATSISERGEATAVIQRTIWRWSAHEQIWEQYHKTDYEKYPQHKGKEGEYFDDEADESSARLTAEQVEARIIEIEKAKTTQSESLLPLYTGNDKGVQQGHSPVNTGDWRLKTKGSQRLKISQGSQPAYGCNEFNIREEGLCHAAVMVRIAIELNQIDSLPESIQSYLEQLKQNQEMTSSELYDKFMSEIVELDNKDKGPESRPTLLADFLRILDEQTEEKEAQKTFPKMKGYSQGGFIHITSLEPSEEEEIKSSIELNLKKQSEDKASEEKEWNSKLIAIQEKAKPKLNKLKAKTLAAAYTSKFSMKRAIDRGDFTAVLALLKNTAEYEVVAGKLKPYVEEREKIGPTPKVLDTKEQERISLLLIGGKTMDTLGEKANRVFFEKLNSIVSDERAKVNKDLPIIIQLMVGMHVICLISDEKTKTTLVDDINCTKLITLSSGQADIFINEAARAISFTEIKDEAKSEAKNIIETHAILYNVKLEVIPTSEKEHVEGWFKGNPKNKLYDPTFYKVTK